MPAERAGYTVTMFLIDVSKSMGKRRQIELPGQNPNDEPYTREITNLEWGLQFVKLKIQEMIYNGRKTDKCGVLIFGCDETNNPVNKRDGGYENVSEYIPIEQPNSSTIAKLNELRPSTDSIGDPMDALIVAVQMQEEYLKSKKTWTRKVTMVTDGESPMELEDWELTVQRMNELEVRLAVVGIDFDSEEYGYHEEDKSHVKSTNESFWHQYCTTLTHGIVGTYEEALEDTAAPDVKETKSVLMGSVLRLGDADKRAETALEIIVKTSKCTSLQRPKSWKKFAPRVRGEDDESDSETEDGSATEDDTDEEAAKAAKGKEKGRAKGKAPATRGTQTLRSTQDTSSGSDIDMDDEDTEVVWINGKRQRGTVYVPVNTRTKYYVRKSKAGIRAAKGEDVDMDGDEDEDDGPVDVEEVLDLEDPAVRETYYDEVEREDLVRGFKYGTSYAPCPEGQFPKLNTKKGIDFCAFFKKEKFRRELVMGEIQYVWADPAQPRQQIALSSIVRAMSKEKVFGIGRWVSKDGADPKMGVLAPCKFDNVDCLLWAPMPFADDVRKYTFPSLTRLLNKKGELVSEHPYIPTRAQCAAMDDFVDAMDLSQAGEKNEEGERTEWFRSEEAYNPALHRTKQAMFHGAVVQNLDRDPVPPPHPDIVRFFDPPSRVLRKARDALEAAKRELKVKQVPKAVPKVKNATHAHAAEEEDEPLLLGPNPPSSPAAAPVPEPEVAPAKKVPSAGSVTEDETDEELLLDTGKERKAKPLLPTPARSASPAASRANRPNSVTDSEPARIVGPTHPLDDFRANLARGDVVSKAVEDLASVVRELVRRPFALRRRKELLECMSTLRQTCLTEDEVDAWNAFIRDLKEDCLGEEAGNEDFWHEVQEVGRRLSLISDDEAKQLGGASEISEEEAQQFME